MITQKSRTSQAQWLEQYEVSSMTDATDKYTVSLKIDGTWACSCKRWIFHPKPKVDCKHILSVQRLKREDGGIYTPVPARPVYVPPVKSEVEQFAIKYWGDNPYPSPVVSRVDALKFAEAFAKSKGSTPAPAAEPEFESQVVGEFKVTRKFRLPQ